MRYQFQSVPYKEVNDFLHEWTVAGWKVHTFNHPEGASYCDILLEREVAL